MKFVGMDKQMVTGYNPQADAKKTVNESFQKEGQEVNSQAPLLLKLNQIRENTPQSVKERIHRISTPAKSGFAMARLV